MTNPNFISPELRAKIEAELTGFKYVPDAPLIAMCERMNYGIQKGHENGDWQVLGFWGNFLKILEHFFKLVKTGDSKHLIAIMCRASFAYDLSKSSYMLAMFEKFSGGD